MKHTHTQRNQRNLIPLKEKFFFLIKETVFYSEGKDDKTKGEIQSKRKQSIARKRYKN